MSDETTPDGQVREGSRIAKVMARAGLCSRRDAEVWIAEGRVSVNGEVLTSPAYNVSDVDDVRVDGQPLAHRERTRLFLFHKPRGLVTTARDPEGRSTIFDALPEDLPRVVAIGRLDINTEGLLLLTNDGGLARILELPSTGWLRKYRVRAHGTIDQAALDGLSDGVTIDGVTYAGIDAKLDREQGSNAWITMGLREGKNREIKKVLEHLGLSVNRLIRVSFGPFELGDLPEHAVMEVRTRVLRDQLGAKLAREAGVDFDSGIVDHTPPPPPAPEPPPRERSERRAPAGRGRAPAPPGRRGETFGRGRDEKPARWEPPPPSTPERKRKHVSALRAEITAEAADDTAPRKRTERSATQDRKGRTVTVERRSRKDAGDDAPVLNEGRPVRAARSARPGRDAPERTRRPSGFEAKAPRGGRDREAGGGRNFARPARAPGAGVKPRGERSGAASKPREDREGGRAPSRARKFDRADGARAEGRHGGERSGGDIPRREGGEGRDFRPRAPGAGFKPRGDRDGASAPRARGADRPDGGRSSRAGGADRPKRTFGEGRDSPRPPRSAGAGFKPRGDRDGVAARRTDRPAGERTGGGERTRRDDADRPKRNVGEGRDSPRPGRAPGSGYKPRGERSGADFKPRGDRSGSDRPGRGDGPPRSTAPRSSAGPGGLSGGRPPGRGPGKGPGKPGGSGPRRPPRKS